MPVDPDPVVPLVRPGARGRIDPTRVQHLPGVGERSGLRVPRSDHDVHERDVPDGSHVAMAGSEVSKSYWTVCVNTTLDLPATTIG